MNAGFVLLLIAYMNNSKALAFLILLILPLCASGQSSIPDSAKLVAIPLWMHWRALHEVKLARACDSLQIHLKAELETSEQIIAKADSLDAIQERRIGLANANEKILVDRLANREDQVEGLKEEVKRQKVFTVAVAVLGVILVVIAL
jgi:hypothetical protein